MFWTVRVSVLAVLAVKNTFYTTLTVVRLSVADTPLTCRGLHIQAIIGIVFNIAENNFIEKEKACSQHNIKHQIYIIPSYHILLYFLWMMLNKWKQIRITSFDTKLWKCMVWTFQVWKYIKLTLCRLSDRHTTNNMVVEFTRQTPKLTARRFKQHNINTLNNMTSHHKKA